MEKVIQQGAEALIIRKDDEVIKRRVKKSYRLEEIDNKIRKLRTRSEGKLLDKASKIISVPKVISVDESKKEIVMDLIKGKKLSTNLDDFPIKKQKEILKQVGESISKLHDSEIIHGDLTTSNMILSDKDKSVYLIDFGLGFHSTKIEDKAVDLHLLRQALEAKHFKHWQTLFSEMLKSYSASKNSEAVLKQFKKVESRGRYKESY